MTNYEAVTSSPKMLAEFIADIVEDFAGDDVADKLLEDLVPWLMQPRDGTSTIG